MQSSRGLTDRDIYIIIGRFIGTLNGDLLGFTFTTLRQFLTFDLQIPEEMYQAGRTMREQLEFALKNTDPSMQTKIVRELLARFPRVPRNEAIPVFFPNLNQREKARREVEHILVKLEPILPLEIPHPVSDSGFVKEALQSARTLLESLGPAHAIDRIHTALHGYLKDKCIEQGISFNPNASITRLYKLLREKHPSLRLPTEWELEIDLIMKAQSTVLEQLNRARNHGSFAHPNLPLPEAEAYLFINAATTFFHYLESKFGV